MGSRGAVSCRWLCQVFWEVCSGLDWDLVLSFVLSLVGWLNVSKIFWLIIGGKLTRWIDDGTGYPLVKRVEVLWYKIRCDHHHVMTPLSLLVFSDLLICFLRPSFVFCVFRRLHVTVRIITFTHRMKILDLFDLLHSALNLPLLLDKISLLPLSLVTHEQLFS